MRHLVLLGDSVFDNGAYVTPGPDVVSQLRPRLPAGWSTSLLAVDGDRAADVLRGQLKAIPPDATHLLVSAGGNDALGEAGLLGAPAGSVAEALTLLADAQDAFRADYRAMLDGVLALGLPTAVCTIYDSNYPEPQRRLVVAALTLFNDVILREAIVRDLPAIDLRRVCPDPEDYANPIEPSVQGGGRIAAAIARLLLADPWPDRSTIWT